MMIRTLFFLSLLVIFMSWTQWVAGQEGDEEENCMMERIFDVVGILTAEVKNMSHNNAALREELQTVKEESKKKVAHLQQNLTASTTAATTLMSIVAYLTNEVEMIKEELGNVKAQLTSEEQRRHELQDKVEKLQVELNMTTESLSADHTKLGLELAQLQTSGNITSSSEPLISNWSLVNRQLEVAKIERDALRERIDKLEFDNKQHNTTILLKQDNSSLRTEVSQIETALNVTRETMIRELASVNEQLKSGKQEMEEMQERISVLEARDDFNCSCQTLQDDVSEVPTGNTQLRTTTLPAGQVCGTNVAMILNAGTVVTQWSSKISGSSPTFFRGGIAYKTNGSLVISQPGLYYVYAMVEVDPQAGQPLAGFAIEVNSKITVAKSLFRRPTTAGGDNERVMFAGAMKYLNAGDSLTVVAAYTSVYDVQEAYCFGVFQIP